MDGEEARSKYLLLGISPSWLPGRFITATEPGLLTKDTFLNLILYIFFVLFIKVIFTVVVFYCYYHYLSSLIS